MNRKKDALNKIGAHSGGRLEIRKLYLTDISFEAPNSPFTFAEDSKPSVDIKLSNQNKIVDKEQYEVRLRVTVTVVHAEKTAYIAEAEQSGLFLISGFGSEVLEAILSVECLNILFPYVRELISDMVSKGGFPQLLLAPMNFALLFKQAKHGLTTNEV